MSSQQLVWVRLFKTAEGKILLGRMFLHVILPRPWRAKQRAKGYSILPVSVQNLVVMKDKGQHSKELRHVSHKQILLAHNCIQCWSRMGKLSLAIVRFLEINNKWTLNPTGIKLAPFSGIGSNLLTLGKKIKIGKFVCKEIRKGTSSQLDFSKFSLVFLLLCLLNISISSFVFINLLYTLNYSCSSVVLAEVSVRIGQTVTLLLCIML